MPAGGFDDIAERFRLDGNPDFDDAQGLHAVIEFDMGATVLNNSRVPRGKGYNEPNPIDDPTNGDPPDVYPAGGHGLGTSRDGYLLSEQKLNGPTSMPRGEINGPPVTVMKLRNADGSPRTVTVNGQTGSEWKLVNSVAGNPMSDPIWVPIQ